MHKGITPPDMPAERPPVGNLTDFVYGVDEKNHLDIQVSVNEIGKVIVFHNRVFKHDVSWFEFDVESCNLDFVFEDGDIRNAGLPLTRDMAKYMQNAHQILMVLVNQETGEAKEGNYIPLILHGK